MYKNVCNIKCIFCITKVRLETLIFRHHWDTMGITIIYIAVIARTFTVYNILLDEVLTNI